MSMTPVLFNASISTMFWVRYIEPRKYYDLVCNITIYCKTLILHTNIKPFTEFLVDGFVKGLLTH